MLHQKLKILSSQAQTVPTPCITLKLVDVYMQYSKQTSTTQIITVVRISTTTRAPANSYNLALLTMCHSQPSYYYLENLTPYFPHMIYNKVFRFRIFFHQK